MLIKRAARIAKTLVRDSLYSSIWRVGIIDKPIHEVRSRDYASATWIEPGDKGLCMADPFGYISEENEYIFFESFRPKSNKGSIRSCVYKGNSRIENQREVLSEDSHKSYPYIFEEDGIRFMICENLVCPDINIYELEGSELTIKTLMIEDFRAVDPSIIKYNGKWWLFCTNADSLECECLYIFHSDGLQGSWIPHIDNPVKRDISSARPAGTPFVHDGVLFRPSQDNSEEYGKRIVINKIIDLSEESFNEEEAYVIDATYALKYNSGTHTISRFGSRTLVDAKVNIPKRKLKEENRGEKCKLT